jgi:hypothetical protein
MVVTKMTRNLILSALLLTAASSAFAQQAFSSLEERMNGKEFTAAGLDKLSSEELAALNAWLRAHSVATLENARVPVAPVGASEDLRGLENQARAAMDDSDIVARIRGPFKGWSGRDTVFELDNGMVWRQNESSTFHMPETDSPRVIIESGILDSWRLRVDGYNKSVSVVRIK